MVLIMIGGELMVLILIDWYGIRWEPNRVLRCKGFVLLGFSWSDQFGRISNFELMEPSLSQKSISWHRGTISIVLSQQKLNDV